MNHQQTNGHQITMPSGQDEREGLAEVLGTLQRALTTSVEALKSPGVAAELQESLHHDRRLPDKTMASLAAATVDMLSQVEQMLQPAHLVLADHFLGYTDTKCLVAANELGLADLLADGPLDVQELASRSSARADRLGQILVPLRNNGIFGYDDGTQKYSNNHVSAMLRSDHWTQWHNWVDLYGNQFYDIARGIPASVRADAVRCAAQVNFDTDMNMFDYFNSRGWMPKLHRTLGAAAAAMAPGMEEDYPWDQVAGRTVLDLGGGSGSLVATLLRRFPDMRGSIYDLPHVIAHSSDLFSKGGAFEDVRDRVPQGNLIGGDFLESVPPAEVYTIKWCLHDWTDESAAVILGNVRRAIVPGPVSRLVVLESILADGRSARLSRYGDINMMMTAGGRERTERQWRELAAATGWAVHEVYPLRNAWFQAIDLRPDGVSASPGEDSTPPGIL